MRSSGCRACPSAGRCGTRCARRPAARAAAGSRSARAAPARARGTRRTSAPSRTTCDHAASPRRLPIGRATVSFARTSEPPCRSVIAIPHSAPALSAAGRSPGSYTVEVSSGAHSSRSAGSARSAGTAANVIESGQPTPASTSASVRNAAARATCAPGRGSRHGDACKPQLTASPSSSCHAGWNSTSSILLPKRSCVRSRGGCSFASRPSSSGSPPSSVPSSRNAVSAQSAPSRTTASASGRFSP